MPEIHHFAFGWINPVLAFVLSFLGVMLGLVLTSRSRDAVGATRTRWLGLAAVSVGVFQGVPLLDLDYVEDSTCETDMNVVMTGSGGFVEVQGTAEGRPFTREQMDELLELARQGIASLVAAQKNALQL